MEIKVSDLIASLQDLAPPPKEDGRIWKIALREPCPSSWTGTENSKEDTVLTVKSKLFRTGQRATYAWVIDIN